MNTLTEGKKKEKSCLHGLTEKVFWGGSSADLSQQSFAEFMGFLKWTVRYILA